jgi:transposase-like protein
MDTSLGVRRRHRSWPEALKREIVAASLLPGASVSVVARQYDVNANQVFTWRKRFGETPSAVPTPVVVTPDQPAAGASAALCDVIEIELVGGTRVRVCGNVRSSALCLVLDALERR